jgi:hypothetical protein
MPKLTVGQLYTFLGLYLKKNKGTKDDLVLINDDVAAEATDHELVWRDCELPEDTSRGLVLYPKDIHATG